MCKAITYGCIAILLVLPGVALAHGHGHVMGTIQTVHQDRLEIVTKEGKSLSIALTKSTKYFRGNKSASAAALEVGSRVVVHLAADGSAAEVRLPEESGARSQK